MQKNGHQLNNTVGQNMSRISLPLSRLVHENLSILMCFAYSQKPLDEMVRTTFEGEWKYLNKAIFEISAARAEKACFELALFLRMLDDEEDISGYFARPTVLNCGRLVRKNGKEEVLTVREISNKIIHTARLEWSFPDSGSPVLISHGRDEEKWQRAEIDLVVLASVCGRLAS